MLLLHAHTPSLLKMGPGVTALNGALSLSSVTAEQDSS
jgi:hypothetical protein